MKGLYRIWLLVLCTFVIAACGGGAPTTQAPTSDASSAATTAPTTAAAETAAPAAAAATEAPTDAPDTAATSAPDATAATGAEPAATGDMAALVEAAEAEGEVTVYSFTSRIARIEEAFEAAYPNIDLVGVDISSTEQIARIKAEQEAGTFEVDVAYISDAPVVYGELVQAGYLEAYVPEQFADSVPEQYQQPLLANRISTKVLMYNEEAHPDGPPVTNLWELTQPEWQGKVVMVDPLVRGDYLDLMTEIVLRSDEMAQAYEEQFGSAIELDQGVETAGEQWIIDLFENGVVLVDDTDNVNAAVGAKGQAEPPIGFTTYSDRRDNEEEGWALQVANDVTPAPGISFPALLGVVKGAPNPNAARLLITFMMGDDTPEGGPGYEPFYVSGDYATRTDITPHPDAVPFDEFRAWQIDTAETFEKRQEVADLIVTLQ
jgi:iron(III) transport system substrate-binding protein